MLKAQGPLVPIPRTRRWAKGHREHNVQIIAMKDILKLNIYGKEGEGGPQR